MKIRIDRERCMGSGSCQFYAPNTFGLDEDTKALVTDPNGDPEEAIQSAASSCPTHAIELLSEAGGSGGA